MDTATKIELNTTQVLELVRSIDHQDVKPETLLEVARLLGDINCDTLEYFEAVDLQNKQLIIELERMETLLNRKYWPFSFLWRRGRDKNL